MVAVDTLHTTFGKRILCNAVLYVTLYGIPFHIRLAKARSSSPTALV